jgi:hypothetical protein
VARKLRIQYPGAFYHVMNRGDRRGAICADDQDRRKFLGWREEDLRARLKGEPAKVELAREVRSRTTKPLAWIAQWLGMGSRGYLTRLLQCRGQNSLGRNRASYDNTIN